MFRDESVVVQLRIGAADAVDFFFLARAERLLRIETPEPLQKTLSSEDFVQAGDAALEIVCGVEEDGVAIGDRDRLRQDVVGREASPEDARVYPWSEQMYI